MRGPPLGPPTPVSFHEPRATLPGQGRADTGSASPFLTRYTARVDEAFVPCPQSTPGRAGAGRRVARHDLSFPDTLLPAYNLGMHDDRRVSWSTTIVRLIGCAAIGTGVGTFFRGSVVRDE